MIRQAAVVLLAVGLMVFACAPKQEVRPPVPAPDQPSAGELKLPSIEPPKEEPAEKKGAAPKADGEKKADEQYVMLNFENTDIETIITTIGEMLKINYIIAPGVTGKITIQSNSKIPMSELFSTFQTVLEMNGFAAVKYGSFYRIVPIDTVKQQPLQIESGKTPVLPRDQSFITQEIPLQYVKATDVANVVRNLMPRGTDFVIYEPSNLLIVTAPPAGIVKFLKLLEAIDIPASDRDAIKTFVYSVENGEAKKLVEILKSIYVKKSGEPAVKSAAPAPAAAPAAPAARTMAQQRAQAQRAAAAAGATVQEALAGEIEGDVIIEAYEDINALLIKTTPRGYLSLLETIRKLDVQPKQVLIEVLIAEITLDNSTQFGIEWLMKASVQSTNRDFDFDVVGGFTDKNSGSLPYSTETNRFLLPEGAGKILSHPANIFANIIAPRKFNMLLTAAATTGRLNVLASPHILALDNKEAKIEIADEVPIPTNITTPIAGAGSVTNVTSSVQFKSAGTILTVTPHINEKKQVTLKLTQEVSEVGKTVPIGGQDYQGFTTRKATTTAIVQDGHTLVLGGIISESKGKARSGIPVLSDLPLVGYLFGSTTDTTKRKELILMVTPRVIANHEEADELTKEMKDRLKGLKEKIDSKGKGDAAEEDVEAGKEPPVL